MFFVLATLLSISTVAIAATPESALEPVLEPASVQQQMLTPSTDSESDSTEDQVTSVSQLSDVQPHDWAILALQSLVER